MSLRVAIVGSGPSGSTVAKILVEAGLSVDLYDVGADAKGVKSTSEKAENRSGGLIPRKALFGSQYMYRRKDSLQILTDTNVSFDTSHAKGGLSTVWGATVGPTTEKDIADWPFEIETMTRHLHSVFGKMKLSARTDQIDIIYPLRLVTPDLQYENVQSAHILHIAELNALLLNKNGIYIGKAKLAIDSEPGSETGCVLCGECMTGCRRGSIFNAWNTVVELLPSSNMQYLGNHLVKRFVEVADGVEIFFVDLTSGTEGSMKYDVLILAAGCIDSTRIVDTSLHWTGHSYTIQDSQKYYFPVWVSRGGVRRDNKSIALAHLYIQGFDSNGNVIQSQLYPGKIIIQSILEHLFGRAGKWMSWLAKPFLNRFFVGVAYFSSHVSGKMAIRFDGADTLAVTGEYNKQSDQEFDSFIKKLIKFRRQTGFSPFSWIKLRSKLGHSQHFGGTIPMRTKPEKHESDEYGRPFGCKNVYMIDSAVLPSIPATPTTGLTMANASRIAAYILQRHS
ncbi:GMC oxidoreductase [Herbaspirillum sp. RTI4]|uniref:GMC oxidoreductase n=1 Tax=Herbaspirillum sp. RTI4 TaxID=3048640 RepID=UPI002AB4FC24|nr:GMC oxidoreductase [Herbaspirillum sp. RTI4]MDY7577621.1 GMC oxidoreductase [Herbaspirillum sp. RTI4]MEA9982213.1 GMC oxidoreductase [Herbaspirillum sp. RTI4]